MITKQDKKRVFDECMRELFRRVGEDYPSDLIKERNWYLMRGWTKEEENSFFNWMTNYLVSSLYWLPNIAELNAR